MEESNHPVVAGHLKSSSRQAAGWKEEKKTFKAFYFRSFVEVAQSGLIIVLKRDSILRRPGCALSVCSGTSTPLCMREKVTTTITVITQEAAGLAQKGIF